MQGNDTISLAESPGFALIGRMGTRPASQIAASSWSVGCETLDRDFAVYANYKQYLGPIGAKAIRVQTGWAKCEKTPGVYNWAWLDEVIDDARAQGVQPWLQLSYGNPIYPGGGNTGLGGGLPASPEALAAWDAWVRAMVRRYKDRVHEWEIWNEPDLAMHDGKMVGQTDAEPYTDLFIRTAEIIRAEQPAARIYGLALAGKEVFATDFLIRLKTLKKTDLLTEVTIHGYPDNPDWLGNIYTMRNLLAQHAPGVTVRQGETGAPSEKTIGAFSNQTWTEIRQAKWNLRRMLQHHGHDVPMNVFTLSDLKYAQQGLVGFNRKGLLFCNDDQTVARPKPAYSAVQRVFGLFDNSLERINTFAYTPANAKLSVFGYRQKEKNGVVVTLWHSDQPPADSSAATPVEITFPNITFTRPVYADLLTGNVYAIPQDRWEMKDGAAVFRALPVGDSPVLIAEESVMLIEKEHQLTPTHEPLNGTNK